MYKIKFLKGKEKEFESLEGADIRGADLEGANLGGANLEGANLEGANLEGADLALANLALANLEGANLRLANLRGADLEGAYLYGADLYGTDLRGANLKAHLRGADLTFTINIISFTLGQHFGFMAIDSKYVKIGCMGYDLDYWLENYEVIGKNNGYNELEIKLYGIQLKALKEISNEFI